MLGGRSWGFWCLVLAVWGGLLRRRWEGDSGLCGVLDAQRREVEAKRTADLCLWVTFLHRTGPWLFRQLPR